MKKSDFIIIAVVLALAAGLFAGLHFFSERGEYVSVEINGSVTERLSLSENTEKTYVTEYGKNTLVIEDGKAFIEDADCPDKICKKHPKIYRNGESIICLPHKLVVTVTGEEEQEVDAVAGR